MIGNYSSMPPTYIQSLIPNDKEYIAYTTSDNYVVLVIGTYDKSEKKLKAERTIYIERQGYEWVIVNDTTPSYTYFDGVSRPYYTYSDYYYGSQKLVNLSTIRTEYYSKMTLIIIVFIVLIYTISKHLRR